MLACVSPVVGSGAAQRLWVKEVRGETAQAYNTTKSTTAYAAQVCEGAGSATAAGAGALRHSSRSRYPGRGSSRSAHDRADS